MGEVLSFSEKPLYSKEQLEYGIIIDPTQGGDEYLECYHFLNSLCKTTQEKMDLAKALALKEGPIKLKLSFTNKGIGFIVSKI